MVKSILLSEKKCCVQVWSIKISIIFDNTDLCPMFYFIFMEKGLETTK